MCPKVVLIARKMDVTGGVLSLVNVWFWTKHVERVMTGNRFHYNSVYEGRKHSHFDRLTQRVAVHVVRVSHGWRSLITMIENYKKRTEKWKSSNRKLYKCMLAQQPRECCHRWSLSHSNCTYLLPSREYVGKRKHVFCIFCVTFICHNKIVQNKIKAV